MGGVRQSHGARAIVARALFWRPCFRVAGLLAPFPQGRCRFRGPVLTLGFVNVQFGVIWFWAPVASARFGAWCDTFTAVG